MAIKALKHEISIKKFRDKQTLNRAINRVNFRFLQEITKAQWVYYLCKRQHGLKITCRIGLQLTSIIKSTRFYGIFFQRSKERLLNYGGKRVNGVNFINDGNIYRLPVKLVFTT